MARCKSCDASIFWAETMRTGKATPIDVTPTPNGNLVVIAGKVRPFLEEDRRLARPRYTSHFATCPDAAAYRRPR